MAVNFQLDINNFIKNQKINFDTTVHSLTIKYYEHKGISDETSVKDWLIGLAEKRYPTYHVVRKHIKSFLKKNYNENSRKRNTQ